MDIGSSKVVVIGGSSGIGFGVAQAALARGARVILVGRSPERLARARDALAPSSSLATIAADASKEDDVRRFFAEVGEVDHLVVTAINSVTDAYAPIGQLTLSGAQKIIDAKLVVPLLLAKHAGGHLREDGSITLTSGIAKDRPMLGGAVVAAVNGALGALARALSLELAPARVNVVSPGWVETPVWDEIAGERKWEMWQRMAARSPAARIATPADIATAYLFAMENEFVTGTTLHVDGGQALV